MTEKKRGRPANTTVKCVWPHVWTSKGRIEEGDEISLPAKEASDLQQQGSCK